MTWTTRAGATTNAMGFAPIGLMPVARRAPYVAIAAWTGGHENVLRTRIREGEVTMGDAPANMPAGKYGDALKGTQARTASLVATDEVPVTVLRSLGFRLPRAVAESHLAHLLGED